MQLCKDHFRQGKLVTIRKLSFQYKTKHKATYDQNRLHIRSITKYPHLKSENHFKAEIFQYPNRI